MLLLESRGNLSEPVFASCGDHQVKAFGRKHVGKRLADAGRRAGNENGSPVLQVLGWLGSGSVIHRVRSITPPPRVAARCPSGGSLALEVRRTTEHAAN